MAVVAGVWALGWSAVGFGFSALLALMTAIPLRFFIASVISGTIGFGVLGFAAGAIFSIALALLEWGSPAEQLTRSRVALSGAIGGALVPASLLLSQIGTGAPLMPMIMAIAIFGALGVATSLGTLRLLRVPLASESAPRAPAGLLGDEERAS